jgi:hypothetical protein
MTEGSGSMILTYESRRGSGRPKNQCCGSGIRCLLDAWSGIRKPVGFYRIPDLGSRIPNPYFWELSDNFLGKKFYNTLKIVTIFFLQLSKIKQFSILWNLCLQKKVSKKNFSPLSDPGSGIPDPGSGIVRDKNPNPRIRATDLRIRSMPFSSVADEMGKI